MPQLAAAEEHPKRAQCDSIYSLMKSINPVPLVSTGHDRSGSSPQMNGLIGASQPFPVAGSPAGGAVGLWDGPVPRSLQGHAQTNSYWQSHSHQTHSSDLPTISLAHSHYTGSVTSRQRDQQSDLSRASGLQYSLFPLTLTWWTSSPILYFQSAADSIFAFILSLRKWQRCVPSQWRSSWDVINVIILFIYCSLN